MVTVGQPMPDFTLMSHSAGEVSSQGLQGTRYVLFVYPKDDTRG